MATTTFVNGVTLTDAGWFNDVDASVYQGTFPSGVTALSFTGATTLTAFANATTLLTLGGTGASAVVALPGTLDWSGTTGALTVAGGVYIAKKLNVSGGVTFASASGSSYYATTYSPSITSSSGTLTSVTGISGTYTQIGRMIFVAFAFTITTNGTGAGALKVTLPVNSSDSVFGFARNTTTGTALQVYSTVGSNTYANITLMASDLYPGADSTSFQGHMQYYT
jgi:hypothetical protein